MGQERSAIADGVPEGTDAGSPLEETGPAVLSPGTRIAGYELGRRLGVGSMGAVYEGVRVADGRPVAIKLLAADLAEKPTARARFLNEATLAARVRHPHVVAVTDSGEASEHVYLVMDLLQGEDLAVRLRRMGSMSVGEALEVLGPICDALASAHRAGVIHRDLKPSNIFLTVRDGQPHPMLLDFGVATDEDATDEGQVSGALTWSGVGTPMYLAPELVADHRDAGPASDQYALGAVLYEMLTGEPPYAAENLPRLLQTIAAGNPPSVRARRPELAPKLDAVVVRAMSADPQARFPSVEDLGRALQAFMASPDTQEQPGRRRPPSSPAISPAIAVEAETPSLFVRTLVPEHEAPGGAWFVAPDAGELFEDEEDDEGEFDESDGVGADPVSAEAESEGVPGEDLGTEDESRRAEPEGPRVEPDSPRVEPDSPRVELESPRLEAAGARADDAPADAAASSDEEPASPRARALPALDWQVVSRLVAKRRGIVLASGVALLGLTVLLAIRGGHTRPRPVSVPPAAAPVTVEKTEPLAPPAPAAVEKTEPTPAAPMPATAAVEKTEPTPTAPTPATATVEKTDPTPAAPVPSVAVEKTAVAPAPAVMDAVEKRERPKAAARRERLAPVSAQESPPPKLVSPAPAPKPRAPENTPVRMHNGVPLLD